MFTSLLARWIRRDRSSSLFFPSDRWQTTQTRGEAAGDWGWTTERLEPRLQLAGDVRAVLTGTGMLRVLGTGDDNQVMVAPDGFGNVRVVGMPGTGTTVNGAAEHTFFATDSNRVERDLLIIMRGGNDYVEVDGIEVGRNLRIVMGPGDDTVGVFDTHVVDDALITTATGEDIVGLSRVTIDDQLRIISGAGHDGVGLAPCVNIGGRLTVSTGGDTDIVLIQGHCADRVLINTGTANDGVYLSNLIAADLVRVTLGTGDDGIAIATMVSSATEGLMIGGGGTDSLLISPFTPLGFRRVSLETETTSLTADTVSVTVATALSDAYVIRGGDPADLPC